MKLLTAAAVLLVVAAIIAGVALWALLDAMRAIQSVGGQPMPYASNALAVPTEAPTPNFTDSAGNDCVVSEGGTAISCSAPDAP